MSSWPTQPAYDREWIATRSDARLSDTPLPAAPPIAAPPPPGRFVVIDDRGLYVREHPVTGAGAAPDRDGLPVTLYVHGLAGSSTNFDSLGTVLAGHTRGFAVDLPGSGHSDPPPGDHYALTDFADLLAELLRRLSPDRPANLVGNSLGGVVSVLLAARHPELVRTLSLVSPAVPDLRLRGERGADPRLGLLLAPGTLPMAVRRLAAIPPLERARGMATLCFGDDRVLTASDLATAAADLEWRGPLPWVHEAVVHQLRALMRSYLRPGRFSFAAAAASITAPTLVVWGTKDRLVDPALAEPTAQAFADHRLLVLPGLGHVAQMEDPVTTARAVLALWQDAATTGGSASATSHEAAHPSGVPRPGVPAAVATSSS